jgi:hypothetical protein
MAADRGRQAGFSKVYDYVSLQKKSQTNHFSTILFSEILISEGGCLMT